MISRRLIRIKVLQVLYSSTKKQENNSITAVEKELFHSINKFYDLYLMLFLLLEEFSNIEARKFEIREHGLSGQNIKRNNVQLSDNEFIKKIVENAELHDYKEKRKLNWKAYSEFVNRFYNSFITDKLYLDYVNLETRSFDDDKKFATKFFRKFVLNSDIFHEFLEESSIYWNDDLYFAILMVSKNVGSLENADAPMSLFPLFKDQDDRDYAKNLLRKTLVNYKKQIEIIQENTKNWDINRITDIDLLILQLALTELFEFSSIPVKVTMNEYIEVAKYYSTQKSNVFVNGVLDKVIKKYKVGEGIRKTGRGLQES